MNGLLPLSYTTIRHWRGEMGIDPLDPNEIHALRVLDAVIRTPEPTDA